MLSCDGSDCTFSASSSAVMHQHLASEHGVSVPSGGDDSSCQSPSGVGSDNVETASSAESRSRSRSGSKSSSKSKKSGSANWKQPSTVTLDRLRGVYFEEFADCKLCGQHCTSFREYKQHLKAHYVEDPAEEWMYCRECHADGTKKYSSFVPHLCS